RRGAPAGPQARHHRAPGGAVRPGRHHRLGRAARAPGRRGGGPPAGAGRAARHSPGPPRAAGRPAARPRPAGPGRRTPALRAAAPDPPAGGGAAPAHAPEPARRERPRGPRSPAAGRRGGRRPRGARVVRRRPGGLHLRRSRAGGPEAQRPPWERGALMDRALDGPRSPRDFAWLVKDFAASTPGVAHALLVSSDGLPLIVSDGLHPDTADSLSAMTSGLLSLGRSIAEHVDEPGCDQIMLKFPTGHFLFMGI